MIARTHGQVATPTTMGKELANFSYRLYTKLGHIRTIGISGKVGGATGSLQSFRVYDNSIDWVTHVEKFISELPFNLKYHKFCTQIEPHDYIVDISGSVHHLNSI